jgi:hypothetical protein
VLVQVHAGRARDVRLAAGGMLVVAAVWSASPVHPPVACPLRASTGIPCPLCGVTRAVVAAVHGDVVASLRYNPIGVVVVLLAVAVLVRPAVLARLRAPVWAVAALAGGLWAYNVAWNPTFT